MRQCLLSQPLVVSWANDLGSFPQSVPATYSRDAPSLSEGPIDSLMSHSSSFHRWSVLTIFVIFLIFFSLYAFVFLLYYMLFSLLYCVCHY